jgi:hypothetical protein
MAYAVFILRDGSWQPWAEYAGPISAREERDYLVNSLGVTAQVFKRVAA